ncbi:MAG: PEP-CTERM-box response regulator transcription factor [Planctomycetes bacterium]|nr:PEP-CTERM-box response regulator transcription factor [Planctomycetota bacterium]
MPRLLIVDDDEQILKQLGWALADAYQVFTARARKAALEIFKREGIHLVLLDLGLPPQPREAVEGLAALEEMLRHDALAKVIIVSGNRERDNALQAVERGAYDIFPKPIEVDELEVVLSRAQWRLEMEMETSGQRQQAARRHFRGLIGTSLKMKAVFDQVEKVARAEVQALILGESGTGKELIARALHQLSGRKNGPFVAINCSAIPENLLESELFGHEKGAFTGASAQRLGKVEYAKGGTLFLDEIGDLAPALQAKLLRFLQEKAIERVGGREFIPVDARVIAATHQDLEKAVKEGRFREDLYFRLAVVKIHLPPLRERGRDVIDLAEHFIEVFAQELNKPSKKLSRKAADILLKYSWPGNVRELENRVKRAMVLAEKSFIGPEELELPEEIETPAAAGASLKKAKESIEHELVERALLENQHNITKAAKALGISRPTLYELMDRYGLDKD